MEVVALLFSWSPCPSGERDGGRNREVERGETPTGRWGNPVALLEHLPRFASESELEGSAPSLPRRTPAPRHRRRLVHCPATICPVRPHLGCALQTISG